MTFRTTAASLALAAFAFPLVAHAETDAPQASSVVATTEVAADAAAAEARPLTLAANTPVELTLNSALTTKANHTGDRFSLTVAQDVLAGGEVVIPKGARAIGLVTFAKGNGSFGKSGKMELAFKYIEYKGAQIPLEGTYFQEGSGNTAGTVGAVVAAGVIGGLVVKGHNAEIVMGKDLNATILQDVPFVKSKGEVALDATYRPAPVSMQTETEKERKKRLKAEAKQQKG